MNMKRDLTSDERLEFDTDCVRAVVDGARTLDQVIEKVALLLKKRNEPWASLMCRNAKLKRQIYTALDRCITRGYIQKGSFRSKYATWEPTLSGTYLHTMVIDDPRIQ